MICSHCGAQNPDENRFCQYCSSPLAGGVPGGAPGGMPGGQGLGIPTLFGDLSTNKTKGTKAMLGVFITLCFSVVWNIVALAVREHESRYGWRMTFVNISTSAWVFLLIFQIAMIVLLIFKLDLVNVMVGTVGIEGISTILFYALCSKYLDLDFIDGAQAVAVTFMILLILGIIVKIVLLCLNSFTRGSFEYLLFIISASYSGAALLFGIITFIVAACSGENSSVIYEMSHRERGWELLFEYCGLGYGFIAYLAALASVAVISIFLYRGHLGTKTKFVMRTAYGNYETPQVFQQPGGQMSGQPIPQAGAVGIQCIAGPNPGQVFSISGEIVVGSGQGQVNIVVAAQGVSRQHCRIRFDVSQNCYYVMDTSTNGTYINNQRIPSGTYTACGRGSVIALVNQGQQYQLL